MARGQKKTSTVSTGANAEATWPKETVVSNHVEEPEYHDASSDHAEGELIEEVQRAAVLEQEEKAELKEIELPKAIPAADEDKNGTFIEGQLERVPFVSQYVAPLLLNRFILPITQKADPFVEAGVRRATPYVEELVERVEQVPEVMRSVPRRLYKSVTQAPERLYHHSVNTATPIVTKMQALPAHAYETTTCIAASSLARVKETSATISKRTTDVSSKFVETFRAAPAQTKEATKQALVNIKAAPTNMLRWAQFCFKNALDNIKAAPGQLYAALMNRKTNLVESIRIARTKAEGASTSVAKSAAITVQPFVHRIFKVVAPRAQSVTKDRRVQSVYQHPFIQGSIEKATPYVSKVTKQPTIKEVVKQVTAWALPAM